MILFVLSEVNRSDQLFSIVEKISFTKNKFIIIYMGLETDDLYQKLTLLHHAEIRIVNQSHSKKFQIALALVRFLIEFRPSVVLSSGRLASLFSMLVAKLFFIRKRIFIRHHTKLTSGLVPIRAKWVDRLTNYSCTDIVAVSPLVARLLTSAENVPARKVHVIPNGIDMDRFQLLAQTANTKLDCQHTFKVGSIGRHNEEKGIDVIEAAIHTLIANQANICWTHVYGNTTKKQEDFSPLNCTPHRRMNFISGIEHVEDFFSSLSAFIHVPTRPDSESFGLVYVEAIAMGVPSFFTRTGILVENSLLQDFYIEVAYDSPLDLVNKLQLFITEQTLRSVESTHKQKAFRLEYSLDTMVNRYMTLLESR